MSLLKRTTTNRIVFFLLFDATCIVVSVILAFLVRFDGQIPVRYISTISSLSFLELLIIPVFFWFNLYFFSWSYVSANELISLVKATIISCAVVTVGTYLFNGSIVFRELPRSILVISFLLIFILCAGTRFSKRIYLHLARPNTMLQQDRTLIVGAGDTGEQVLRIILASKPPKYWLVGFADDSNIKQGIKIHGLKVLGRIADIPAIAKRYEVRQLIIALPWDNSRAIREAVEFGKQAGIRKIKIAPSLGQLMRGEGALKNLKDVDVEDLLGREAVTLDKKQIEQFIKGKVVLVTGAAGSIGSELAIQLAAVKPSTLLLLDQDETGIFTIVQRLREKFPELTLKPLVMDILDEKKLQHIFSVYAPGIVFHAAAYKHVPLMEANPDEAIKNNIFGTDILLKTSVAHQVEKFIFISTDKAVNPTSVMGSTKRVGEMLCQLYSSTSGTKCISVRFGNVLNSRGSVIPIFREQIKKGGPVEVTDPRMQRYFMLTKEACLLVMQAGAMGHGGEVFVLDMGKPVNILDLAKDMIRLSGFEPDRDIAIVISGIRPGEKLFEEILTAEEGTVATQHQKIFMARLAAIKQSEFNRGMELLMASVSRQDFAAAVDHLRQLVLLHR